ncbi:S-methyl-5-thioribose kinase [Priestia taiwanensis]|uniref:Methylthioribose kinase n=1 Tax=Priestia taiwanensis TaxID=1347902 RepID=A0A917ER51_9BACI|nr:S-methyl-5-thioribose kinase [Priestia taiwanensis]MBM7363244.1 5-methylthioribose kinase [Priestia taiwanensis]GGE68861.1 methylthioribose kinase [Priestia taiwanensis]
MSNKNYAPLTEESAITLAKELAYFTAEEHVTCEEIGDGNLNLVFRIKGFERSIIIKQALPYAKVVGESWPLSLKRAEIESHALRIQGQYVPHLVPKVFHEDHDLAVTIMEDLSHLTIARKGLIDGEDYPLLSTHIGTFLAHTLFFTSDFGLHASKKRELDSQFCNPDLCDITEGLVFTDPFGPYETNNFEPALQEDVEQIWNNVSLKERVAQLKYSFLTHKEALLHGDLHTGSIFASETETKVIDPEFACFGPIGFDIGQFFANLLLQAISREEERQAVLFTHIETTWNVFSDTFSALWHQHSVDAYTTLDTWRIAVLANIFREAVGFAGCEIIRRTIGLAHVADLDGIEDETRRIHAKKQALKLGTALLLHDVNTVDAQFYDRIFKTIKNEVNA